MKTLCANFIWRHWTYKMPVRYSLPSVWVSIFSQLSIKQHMGLCVFSLPIPFVMIERIYILCLIIIIKSEVWNITHCLGLGHETMVCAVCLSIFLWSGYFTPHLPGGHVKSNHIRRTTNWIRLHNSSPSPPDSATNGWLSPPLCDYLMHH